ncbi:MAG: IclR family transcriptional regulator [Gammaproteobacteria bacterium]|nr:IclR family transcriptional regulator [Gammaproteobacteria bacterium]MDH5304281.1 IclR family transcriptional regulator [Gammaproteobacteria bacterium]MDH5321547.1 IclR family transcriptional regulator [Gammaproteobacteria bacterium]
MSALSKGFKIIDAVTAAGSGGLPFAGIVAATGVAKASTHRLLQELVDLSALRLDAQTRHYHGGLLLARIGATITANYDLRNAVRPFLQSLHDEFGHVATLGVLNNDVGVYIDKIEASGFGLRLHSEIGKSFPLHCTAMGKVLLSFSDAALVRRVTKRKLEKFTPRTITDASKLRQELKQVEADGYAIDNEEITRGFVCVAAPIFRIDGSIAGAMSCTFPSYICQERGMQAEIDAVRRLAAAASAC